MRIKTELGGQETEDGRPEVISIKRIKNQESRIIKTEDGRLEVISIKNQELRDKIKDGRQRRLEFRVESRRLDIAKGEYESRIKTEDRGRKTRGN